MASKDGVLFCQDFERWPVVEVEMHGQKWGRWAQLYYVEGQKYSIGQRFESRAAQGEYLFCYQTGVSTKATHCEIICEDGSFWIVDLKGSNGGGTFVNGSRINVGNKTELRFGDIVSLGGVAYLGGDENEEGKDKCTAFLFNSSGEGEGCDHDMLISKEGEAEKEKLFPVGNSLVFSKILSYLPPSDIKNCRLVSSEWTEETSKVLLKLSLPRLNFTHGYAPHTERTLFSFIQEMGQIVSQGRLYLKLPNCICDNQFGKYDYDSCGMEIPLMGTPPHKFWFDLEWFFDGGFPHPVTMLKLNGSLRCEQGVTLCKTVLERVKHTLEDLDLILDFDVKIEGVPKPFCISFPVLKTLGITLQSTFIPRKDFDEYDEFTDEEYFGGVPNYSFKMNDWITSMIQSAPGVQTLKLKTWTAMALEFHNFVLKTIIGNEGFTNLNSLELRNYNQDSLKLLLKLPRTLQSLSLEHDKDDVKTWRQNRMEHEQMYADTSSEDSDGECVEGNCKCKCDSDDDVKEEGSEYIESEVGYNDSDDDVEKEDGDDIEVDYGDSDDGQDDRGGADFEITMEFKMLLENVLQKMASELKYLCIYIPNLMVLKQNTIQIQMPAFPNLKVFKLNGFRKNCINFSDFGLDYEKYFPLLKHLGIHSLTNGKNFFEIFRPIKADYEFKRLRILDLKLENRKRRWSLTSLKRLSKLFPNVINPQLENVRELPPFDL